MWDLIDRWSQVLDSPDTLQVVVPAPKTLLTTKTANRSSTPHHLLRAPSQPFIVSVPRAPPQPATVAASSAVERVDQFRRRSLSLPTITPLHSTVALRSATLADLQSWEATQKAAGEGQGDAGRQLRRLLRQGTAPTRSLKIRREECAGAAQGPAAAAARHVTRVSGARRSSLSSSVEEEQPGAQDSAGRALVGRKPAYAPRRRGSM